MRLSLPVLVLAATLVSGPLLAQEREQVSEKSGTKYNPGDEVYYVLKGSTVKDGPYQLFHNGKLNITGFYDHGKKDSVWEIHNSRGNLVSRRWYTKGQNTGNWQFFGGKGEPEWSYDFTSNRFSIQHDSSPFIDTSACYYLSEAGTWAHSYLEKPLLPLLGNGEWFNYLGRTMNYPVDAINNEQMGDVIVSVNVNEQGTVTDYGVAQKTAVASLNAEALRVVRLYPFEFIPAEENGVKIRAQYRVMVRFILEEKPPRSKSGR